MTPPIAYTHADRSGEFSLPLPLDRALAFFTPLGERHWAQGWDPHFCHPASGLPSDGAVFLTTPADAVTTIWVLTEYAPEAGRLSYARDAPTCGGHRPRPVPGSSATDDERAVEYHMTALSEAGNTFVATFAHDHNPHWISAWETAIRHYLQHGSKIEHP